MSDGAATIAQPDPIATGTPVAAPATVVEPVAVAVPESGAVAAPAEGAAPSEAPAAPELRAHTDDAGLLAGEAKPEEPPPAEAPTEAKVEGEAEKPAAETAPQEAAPLTYDPPTLPEGLAIDAERIGAFDALLGGARVPAEVRQQLVDMHLAERQAWESSTQQMQHDAFAAMRREWQDRVRGDQELGGAGFNTSINAARRGIELLVPEEHRQAFQDFIKTTGATDHPEMIRLLVRAQRLLSEAAPAPPPHAGTPDRGRPNGAGPRSVRSFYTNPRSQEVFGGGGSR